MIAYAGLEKWIWLVRFRAPLTSIKICDWINYWVKKTISICNTHCQSQFWSSTSAIMSVSSLRTFSTWRCPIRNRMRYNQTLTTEELNWSSLTVLSIYPIKYFYFLPASIDYHIITSETRIESEEFFSLIDFRNSVLNFLVKTGS